MERSSKSKSPLNFGLLNVQAGLTEESVDSVIQLL